MENTIFQLQQLFNNAIFHIPQYQRAYSWVDDPHLDAFLEDLRQQVTSSQRSQQKQYFLGTFLLHKRPDLGSDSFEHHDIVDGQQRLTTAVVFFASALTLAKSGEIPLDAKDVKMLKRAFIQDDDAECQKFHTILEDEPFFQSAIIKTSAASPELNCQTPSSKRLEAALAFFQKNVKGSEWPLLLKALREARVMVYVVNTSADATQIFELQNDRGKRLTDLEALKSFLMHAIYLHAKTPEDKLAAVQSCFSKIFRTVEVLDNIKSAPEEDAILSYYCVAFTPWKSDEWRNPKKHAKGSITQLIETGNEQNVIPWIEKFVGGLVSAFTAVNSILGKRDELPAFSELFVLGRLAPFWPLLLKAWQQDQTSTKKPYFEATCRLMEIYAIRGYGISNMRSDGGLATLYTKARDFSGDFPMLTAELKQMCGLYNIEKRFLDGLENPNIYNTDKDDVRYLLWKYENYLRQKTGQKQPFLSWRDYFEPRDVASRFTIEHIAAQDDPASKLDIEWDVGVPKLRFSEIALHRLGNLVLDSASPNSAKGKEMFSNKLQYFVGRSIYLSQSELTAFTEKKDPKGNLIWEAQAIKKRHQTMVEFAKSEWNPERVNS